jgi:hypothetical protein
MKTLINRKVFFLLWIASIGATVAVLPYSLALQSNTLQNLDLPIPLPVAIMLQILQSSILFAIAIVAGMFFARRVGLGTPILDSAARGESVADRVWRLLPLSILLGAIGTLIILGLEAAMISHFSADIVLHVLLAL